MVSDFRYAIFSNIDSAMGFITACHNWSPAQGGGYGQPQQHPTDPQWAVMIIPEIPQELVDAHCTEENHSAGIVYSLPLDWFDPSVLQQ